MPRAGLDRAAVVHAAAALADTIGLEEVTLADLAARLKVRVPSLYNHVAGLAGLRRELSLLALEELSARLQRAALGKARDEAVMAVAHAYRAFANEHPGLYAAALRAPDPEDAEAQAAAREVVEIVVAILASYGLQGDAAVHTVRALRSFLHGFVSLEATGGFGLPLDRDESFRRMTQIFISGMHREEIAISRPA